MGEMHAKIRWTLKRVICLLTMIMMMNLAFVCGGSSGTCTPHRRDVKLGNAILVALYSKSDRELSSGSQIRSCPFSLHVRPSEKSYLSQHASDICTDIGHLRHDSLPGRTPAHSSATGSHPV
ncbi:hypothetical protein BDN71DRAFT_1449976 [Pleurotus eryngii]|uniref:Uncharacterized protein n=1 Tax=Pleurotus eryngii TaxID=5323 RepID=A0A9P5ZU49_PLEER|nr:hypothetical protein BDN71DRAFT_1449976 [Pleurotus eryngii]